MWWLNDLHREMEIAVLRFGLIAAGAGCALGIIVDIAIGWLLFGGGA